MKTKNTRRGFTLIELLVVVLIIGILGAIALPQYQKAVLKSRFAALMPIGKAIADSNEAYYLEHGHYADNAQDLPVQGQMEYPDGTELEFGTTSEYAYVLATRAQANNKPFPNHYIVYQKRSEKFPDNIHCEALESNDQAKEVCLSLGGEKIDGSLKDGYLTYVLSGMRTLNDKFPTSIMKLKAQICGTQFTGADCIVDEANNTITTQECTGSFTSNGAGTRNCTKRTYDDTAAQINYVRERTTCNNYSNGDIITCYTYPYAGNSNNVITSTSVTIGCFLASGGVFQSNGECIASRVSNGYFSMVEERKNEQRTETYYYCREVTDGQCSSIETTVRTYNN